MAITPGTPAVRPPVPGDPLNLADTPSTNQNYDVVINGVGYMLFRGQDDGVPSQYYSLEPADYSYSQTFIPRTNVNGDYGDNQQDFYMTWTQRDWSGGEGQKFYRQAEDKERSYWDGNSVRPTEEPGGVVLGPREATISVASATAACNLVYVKETSTGTLGDAIIKVEAQNASVAATYYSTDGGDTWTAQCTGGPILADCADLIAGDNGQVFLLCTEFSGGNSKVYYCSGTGAGSWTAVPTLAGKVIHLEWFNGALYGARTGAILSKIDTTGSTSGTMTTIKDLGGGQIIDMKASAGQLWILYESALADYRLISWDGAAFSEVATLPKGWRLPPATETNAYTHPVATRCIAFQDGVVYIAGLLPTNNALVSANNAWTYRSALWFYAGGNSGLIWQGNFVSQSFSHCGGAIGVIDGGIIVWVDHADFRLMAYDPRTGGVFTLSTINSKPSGSSLPPICRLEYDQENHVLFGVWLKDYDINNIPAGTGYVMTFNKISRWRLRKSPQNVTDQAYVTSSQFDFDSSLPKYFSSIAIDGDPAPYSGDATHPSTFDIYYQIDGIDSSGYTLLQASATPGTFYPVGLTGRSMSVKVVMNLNASASFGPLLNRISVRAAPIQTAFRQREYVLALFNELPLLDGTMETSTPSDLAKALDAAITANAPVNVSDATMTNVKCVFMPDTKFREVRPNEYLAFVKLREV